LSAPFPPSFISILYFFKIFFFDLYRKKHNSRKPPLCAWGRPFGLRSERRGGESDFPRKAYLSHRKREVRFAGEVLSLASLSMREARASCRTIGATTFLSSLSEMGGKGGSNDYRGCYPPVTFFECNWSVTTPVLPLEGGSNSPPRLHTQNPGGGG
jgi:hypothetical protein